MAKKTVQNATKPPPSMLTVASPTEASPAAPPKRLRRAAPKPKLPPAPTVVGVNPVPQMLPPESPEQAAGAAQAHLPTSPQAVHATFVLLEPHAKQVSLCGDFNAWSPVATPMTRQTDGHWVATLALRPGRHQYKFVADGQWLPDPNAHEFVPNEFGSLNSVIEVRG
jgi:hypothetical protein